MPFRQAEQALTPDELARAETALGIARPPAMRAQEQQRNGCVPVWSRWPEKTGGSPAILLSECIALWDRSAQPTWVRASFDAVMAGLQPDDSRMPGSPVPPEHAFRAQVFDHYHVWGGDARIQLDECEAQRPSPRQLAGDADTDRVFVADMDGALAQIEAQGIADAQCLFADHFAIHPEDLPRAAMQNPLSLRVQAGKTVCLAMGYALDPEHVAGIAST